MMAQGDPIVRDYRARLALYASNKPYRDAANNWSLAWGL